MKPICVPCQRFYRPIKTGFYFIEGMPNKGARPGTEDAEHWSPYKLWSGDKWRCEGCGSEIISGTGAKPIAIQHETDFAAKLKSFRAEYQVNDC